MLLSQLQTHNHKFTIAAFDHRSSLSEVLGINVHTEEGVAQFIELKQLFMEVFSPMASAVLTDPVYGKFTVDRKVTKAGLLMSLEESGYEGGKGVVPPLLENWGVLGVKGYDAAAKLLLYFNPEEPNAAKKLSLVKDLHTQTQAQELPFLVEPVLYPLEGQTNFEIQWAELQQRTVEQLDEYCDVLKIEFPGLYANTDDEKARACQLINQYASKPWIILSRGMGYEEFSRAVEISLLHGGSGFAVGRAVWQEIEQWSIDKTGNWPESLDKIRQFLTGTGTVRMRALINQVVNS